MSEYKLNKIIKFYHINPLPCLSANKTTDEENLREIFFTFLNDDNSKNTYKFTKDKKNYTFDIIEKTNDYIFATCCKSEDFNNELFFQKRNLTDNTTEPYKQNPDEEFERFTYFVIDFKKNKLAAIYNKSITELSKLLPELLNTYERDNLPIEISPIIIDNPKEFLKNKFVEELTFFGDKFDNMIVPLSDVLKNNSCDVSKFNLTISIKKQDKNFIQDIFNFSKEKQKKIIIKAKNEYGLTDTIDLLETILTKRVPINISKEEVFNKETVKSILISEIKKEFYK